MIVPSAMILDAIIGDPRWLWSRVPHPVVLIGRLIAAIDEKWNKGTARKLKGFGLLAGLVTLGHLIGVLISSLPFHWFFEIIIGAIFIAQKSLVEHVTSVANGLKLSIEKGRREVSMIVGRDTKNMDRSAVARAAIESAAENLSDGVVAPVFWFAIAGMPGLLIYKFINTADSMIGYRTERHAAFGFAAAKFDDLLNWIPARLTAFLIVLLYGLSNNWREITSEAKRHRSPNAGWPEAAASRALGVALSGPRIYDGKLTDDPFVNPDGRKYLLGSDILAGTRLLWTIWAGLFVLVLALSLLVTTF